MEKEDSRRSGFSVSDNKSSSSNSDDVVSLVKLHSVEEALTSKIWMKGIHHQHNNMDRRFDGGGGGGGGGGGTGGGGGGGGPTGSYSGGAIEAVGHMYHDNVSSSCLGAENFSTNSQPFDIFVAPYSTTTTPYKSPEGMMATGVAFPFTCAQWKELERQAMIYKYMISSLPVPPDLLFPLSRNFPSSAVDSSVSPMYNGRYSKNGDREPGRCKRTDGKKWRCSRDVAPHQKYCERHLHRGRPRSRKPVEVKNNPENSNKKTRIEQSNLPNSTATNDKPLLLFDPKNDLNISNAPSCNRDLSLMMEGEQRWQHLIETNMGFANEGCSIYDPTSIFHQEYVEQNPLNVLSYSSFPATEIDAPIGFIDAWSINNGNVESSFSSNHENLSPSLNLSISMASGSILDQEMARVNYCDDQSIKDSRWLGPVSWEPFTQGGPLAEALPVLGCQNLASPRDSISTAATAVSSPTGVLHRTLFSHSDGSVCNSPTFAASTSEAAFNRLN